MHVIDWLRKNLFYGGLDEERFRQIQEAVRERNRKFLVFWSVACALIYVAAAFLYDVWDSALGVSILVVSLVTGAVTLACALFFSKRHPWTVTAGMYLWELSVLGNAVALAVYHAPARDSGTIVIAALVPTVFLDRTIVLTLFELLTVASYAVMGKCGLIPPDVCAWGLLSLAVYSVIGILNGHFINRDRYERFVYQDSVRKYAELQESYNRDLQKDVAAKTEQIVALHDQLVIGMAAMVEGRDNSTGGHIRRTSAGVRILTEAIRENGALHLSDEFCGKIVKAAPMHDLGKIAVDDAILRKPGRYTPEEYAKMKIHAAEGARIVHEILKGTEDEEFRRIAENIAHYHHERTDGSGYPDGLKGDEIPLEARIMAIADVYDALVSRRVYKDSYSFEKADRIILEGMGTQFDPALRAAYEAARPRLEAYYTGSEAAAADGVAQP